MKLGSDIECVPAASCGKHEAGYVSLVVPSRAAERSAERCPPCFNCQLDAFDCGQFGECSAYDGQCKCPPGWAGIDCLTPRTFRRLSEHGWC